MKVWCVKYAFTTGIVPVDGELQSDQQIYGRILSKGKYSYPFFLKQNEWSETLDGALHLVEDMRAARIQLLQKQIKKLLTLKVKVREA